MTESGWNDSVASVQQIEAKAQERQVAALKRERALAYAHTQQVWITIWSHDLYAIIHASHPHKKFLPFEFEVVINMKCFILGRIVLECLSSSLVLPDFC